jgi:predicted N-acetyltransferase YhbS
VRGRIVYRPTREDDVPAIHAVNSAAFQQLDEQFGVYPGPSPSLAQLKVRFRHQLRKDPGGAWVAERDGEIVGSTAAILREGLWGLSGLAVHPSAQSEGVGRELLARARAYGDGARAWVVLSSRDPRAMRAYSRIGLELHPCVTAFGRPRNVVGPPGGVRPGGPQDLPLTEAVDRAVRGAAHGEDILALLATGSTMLVAPERGYVVMRDTALRLLAAFDEEAARDLLRAALARPAANGEEAFVEWLTARQPWAVEVCLEAGLELDAGSGPIFLAGDVGPFRPYLPSGSYL